MSLVGVIASMPHADYLVTRRSSGPYVNGVYQMPPIFDRDVTAINVATNALTIAAHGLLAGAGPFQGTTNNTLPGNVIAATPYWAIVVDANTIKIATSPANALALVAVDILDAGIGTLHLSSRFTITAGIQPDDGDTIQDLPEGQHAEETRLVFTLSELKTRSPGYEPDLITIDGESWRVDKIKKWSKHYQAWIVRLATP